jgi:hypothetical protein
MVGIQNTKIYEVPGEVFLDGTGECDRGERDHMFRSSYSRRTSSSGPRTLKDFY